MSLAELGLFPHGWDHLGREQFRLAAFWVGDEVELGEFEPNEPEESFGNLIGRTGHEVG